MFHKLVISSILLICFYIGVTAQQIPDDTVYTTDIAWNKDYTLMAIVGIHPGTIVIPGGVIENPGFDSEVNTFGYISVVNTTTGKEVFTVTPPSAFTSVAWSPDGSSLALGSYDGSVWIVSANTGERITSLFGHQATVTDVDWSNDGKRIVSSGNWDERVILWDATSYQLITTLTVPGFPSSVTFTPDDQSIVLGADSGVYLFPVDLKDGSDLYRNYRIDENWVTSLAISNDGTYIVSGGIALTSDITGKRSSANIDLIDLYNTEVITEIQSDKGSVRRIVWTQDKAFVAVVSEDNIVQIIDPFTGTVQLGFLTQGAERYNLGVTFSEYGGRLIYTSSFDGAIFSQNKSIQKTVPLSLPIQIVVPLATLDRFTEIAASCNAPATLTDFDSSMQAQTLIGQLDALPEGAIPLGCEADLRAIAEAIGAESGR